MTKINIYQMSLNPCMLDKTKEKSETIRKVFKAYKEHIDKDAQMGEVHMHSFSPKDSAGYGKYTDFRIDEIEGPAIFIISSLYDLDNDASKAFSRLVYALSFKTIKAIYITNYHEEVDVSKYIKILNQIFYDGRGKTAKSRRTEVPKTLVHEIVELRKLDEPVLLSDIAETVNLAPSMVRKYSMYSSARNAGPGVPIKPGQVQQLRDAIDIAREEEYMRFNIKEEIYID